MKHIGWLFLCSCGVSKKTLLIELDAEQLDKVCSGLQGERTYLCEKDGFFIEFTIGAGCIERNRDLPGDCTTTVGELEDCDEARHALYEEDPCGTEPIDLCGKVDSCYLDVQ